MERFACALTDRAHDNAYCFPSGRPTATPRTRTDTANSDWGMSTPQER